MHIYVDSTISLRLPKKTDVEPLFELIESNKTHLDTWNRWLSQVGSLKMLYYFIERNERQYKELLLHNNPASQHPGFQLLIMEENQICGMLGFQGIHLVNDICSLGYWIAAKHEGRGLVSRSVKKLIEYAFEVLNLNRIEIQCRTDNERSVRVANRLGFRQEAIMKEAEKIEDCFVDHYLFRLLRSEHFQE